ncbi:MAG: DUF1841 family protein [Gammaproteobacteria bacterium]
MFASSRTDTRRFFRDTWRKRCAGLPLEPIETIVADVVAAHPEFHAALAGDLPDVDYDADPVANPFLHMGLHVALVEQLQADRPHGIRAEFARLKAGDTTVHDAEHRILTVLAETLWRAQSRGAMPDEAEFLAALRRLA